MKYEFLNDEQKANVVRSNIAAVEQEHYALDVAQAREHALDNQAGAENLLARQAGLEDQHKVLKALLKELGVE